MSPDLDRFKKSLIYTRRSPIDAILDDLAELRKFDGKNEKLNILWVLVGIVGILGLFWGFAAGHHRQGVESPPFWVRIVIPGILILVGFGLAITRSKYNLENRRYELAERILRFLRRDSRPDAVVSIQTDLRKPTHKSKYTRKGKVGVWNVNYYTDRWLQIQGRLLDGTAYQLRVVERHQVRSKTYRSSSGKTKSKTKTKSATELNLRLKVKTRTYPGLATTGDASKTVQLPDWVRLKAVQIQAPVQSPVGTLLLRTATKQPWTCGSDGKAELPTSGVRWFAMSFLSLYQTLNLARNPEKA